MWYDCSTICGTICGTIQRVNPLSKDRPTINPLSKDTLTNNLLSVSYQAPRHCSTIDLNDYRYLDPNDANIKNPVTGRKKLPDSRARVKRSFNGGLARHTRHEMKM